MPAALKSRGRRATLAVVVVAGHLTVCIVLRNEFTPAPPVTGPDSVSVFLAFPLSREHPPTGSAERHRAAHQSPRGVGHGRPLVSPGSTARSSSPPTRPELPRAHAAGGTPRDWYRDLPAIAEAQVATEAARAGADQWLARGTDPQTHPLLQAFQPLYPPEKTTFTWDHVHAHRVDHIEGGGLLVWLNDHCAVAIYALLVLPGCAIGHIETNGALFQDMHLEERIDTPLSLPR
ncbi:MAG TPA: hypothetical protein VME21_12750 [Steroidobacteraceae bacterium]|nr:hypothetical protein [Steroidobacteraceae bacterium]